MNRGIACVGMSHHNAPLEERERLAMGREDEQGAVQRLNVLAGVEESVVVSTCNRVEIYVAGEPGRLVEAVHEHVASACGVTQEWLDKYMYARESDAAVRHLFRVAASLDSLVVGEPQIVGQVKKAFTLASDAGGTGPLLNRLFHNAFRAAKRVRKETQVAENAVSVSYAGVELAKKVFGRLHGKSVLVVGAGKMGGLAVRHLRDAGVERVYIANRTADRARDMAKALGASAPALDELEQLLGDVDIVISSTGSQHYVIKHDVVKAALSKRKYRPLFLIDIAVPRDIDPRCASLSNVYLFDMDDLEKVVEANLAARRAEAARAETIVAEEVEGTMRWIAEHEVVPTIVSLRQKMTRLKDQELARMRKDNPDLPDEAREAAERMARALINKVLHEPTVSLRRATGTGHQSALVTAVRSLFDLNEDGDGGVQSKETA